MFVLNEDKSIYITRGDVAFFSVVAKTDTGEIFKFQPGDVVRFKVYEKRACENVVLSKNFGIEAETEEVGIYLEEKDTKIGDVISKPTEYWYEVELNPYTDPQTILGYDEDGAKVFMLYPEGNEAEDSELITPEDVPVVDEKLNLESTRPVQNQAISRAITKINKDIEGVGNRIDEVNLKVNNGLTNAKGQKITNVADPTNDGDAVNLRFIKEHCYVRTMMIPLTMASKKGLFYSTVSLDGVTVLGVYSTEKYKLELLNNTSIFITNRETNEPADYVEDPNELAFANILIFDNTLTLH